MKLEWSRYAQVDRIAIFDYIEADSPQAAVLVDERIQSQIEKLIRTPEIGRPGRVTGTRELVIQRTPYIAPSDCRQYHPHLTHSAWRTAVANGAGR